MARQQRGRKRDKGGSTAGGSKRARGEALFVEAQRLHQAGALDEAEAFYRRIVDADPGHAKAQHYLGAAAAQRGELENAAAMIERALALAPDYVEAHRNLAIVLKRQGRLDEAVARYRLALTLRPDDAETHHRLGALLDGLGRTAEAAASYRQAVALDPDFAEAFNDLGATLYGQGALDEAIAAYRRAVALDPANAEAHNNLGVALKRQGSLEAAVASYKQSLARKPDAATCDNLGKALLAQSRVEEAAASFRRALALAPDDARAHSDLLLCLQYQSTVTPKALAEAHFAYGSRFGLPPGATIRHDNAPLPDRRLRIGYASADLGRHPVGYFLAPVLAAHDRAAFAIHCYSSRAAEDQVTARCKAACDSWHVVADLDDAELARRIRADGIDILVDLAGHTGDNRLRCFALKPAPVQATWLGYPGTTGLREIDYRLTDAVADPPGAADDLSSEILVRLPNGFLCYEPPASVVPPPAISRQITFGSFNNLAKVDGDVAALWARILHRVPFSRLVLKSLQTADPPTWRRYLALFAAHGIAGDRIVALPWLPSAEDNLAAYAQLDVALDPFPYNGTTTSCDALWMGVPVVTLAGDRHAGRVGASIATRLGMAELIAGTPDDYVEIAVGLAADTSRLAALRAALRERFRASKLHDAAGLARDIEAAYRRMWQLWCAGRG